MNLHHLFPGISDAHVAAELEREEIQRRAFYPRQVETLRMSAADAQHELAAVAAWREDLARFTGAPPYATGLKPAQHGLTWLARRHAIAREIQLRGRVYPRQIGELKLTRDDAAHRIACLEAMAARYDDGLDWCASNGRRCSHELFAADDADRLSAREWATHREAVEAARNPAKQEAML